MNLAHTERANRKQEIFETMKRTLTAILTLGIAASALTLATFDKEFMKTYDVKKGSRIDAANCMTCHEKKTGGKLNAYGLDLQKAMKAAKSRKLTAEILKSVEGLDSNKNGKSNLQDIKSDVLPGE